MVIVAQLVRAPGCGPGGRGFKSPHSPHFICPFHFFWKGLFYSSIFVISSPVFILPPVITLQKIPFRGITHFPTS